MKIKEAKRINEIIDAIRLRVDVFILEQKCPPGWEPDALDKDARHFVVIADNQIVGTLRLRTTKKGEFKIERMATKKEYRQKGYGKKLIEFVLNVIKKENPKKIWIESQVQAQKFYEKLGFKPISETYDLYNLGIPHIKMEFKK